MKEKIKFAFALVVVAALFVLMFYMWMNTASIPRAGP
jgi:multidrug resistance efflux pump